MDDMVTRRKAIKAIRRAAGDACDAFGGDMDDFLTGKLDIELTDDNWDEEMDKWAASILDKVRE